jgi:citrate synthase
MFTVMFAIGIPGWIAQWKEMREQRTNRKTKTDLYWTPFEGF